MRSTSTVPRAAADWTPRARRWDQRIGKHFAQQDLRRESRGAGYLRIILILGFRQPRFSGPAPARPRRARQRQCRQNHLMQQRAGDVEARRQQAFDQ